MKNTDDLFNPLASKALTELINGSNNNNSSGQIRFVLALLGLLAFVGVETVKVIFRKNFGEKGLHTGKIVLCFLVFIGIGLIVYMIYTQDNQNETVEFIGNRASYLVTAVFYMLLGIYVLVKGLLEKAKSKKPNKIHPLYRGKSTILSFLTKEGWSQNRVQNVAEPLLTLALGIFLLAYNLLLGLPLIFCAISVWVYLVFEQILGINVVETTMQERGYNRGRNFSEVQN